MKVKCKCQQCFKDVVVEIPKKVFKEHPEYIKGVSCNQCIPENSAARDGINESIYTEVNKKKKENANDKMMKWLRML